jgi:hypothetical protein
MLTVKRNPKLAERIERFGDTVDLPLFDQPKTAGSNKNYPKWLCTGTSVKADVWDKIKGSERLNDDAWTILSTMITHGGRMTDNEIEEATGMRINIITGRRNNLIEAGLVTGFPDITKKGKSGKPNKIWHVNFKNLYNRIHGA